MKITYDPEAQALYIYVKDGDRQPKTIELDNRVWVDRNKDNTIRGIEILYVESLKLEVN